MSNDKDLEEFEDQAINAPEEEKDEGSKRPRPDRSIDARENVPMNVQVVIGTTQIPLSQILNLSRGSVVELERKLGDPVDLVVNGRVVARGDLVKVGDNSVGVTLNEIVKEHVSEEI
jgi:flagellar motor switch protein FliN